MQLKLLSKLYWVKTMENKYELMWKLLKRDLNEEYINAKEYYESTKEKGWAGTYTTYLMAQAMMKTLEDLDMEDLKGLE